MALPRHILYPDQTSPPVPNPFPRPVPYLFDRDMSIPHGVLDAFVEMHHPRLTRFLLCELGIEPSKARFALHTLSRESREAEGIARMLECRLNGDSVDRARREWEEGVDDWKGEEGDMPSCMQRRRELLSVSRLSPAIS